MKKNVFLYFSPTDLRNWFVTVCLKVKMKCVRLCGSVSLCDRDREPGREGECECVLVLVCCGVTDGQISRIRPEARN